jgi:alkylation response protein AidB-like acyl-CoA dehydrogenase
MAANRDDVDGANDVDDVDAVEDIESFRLRARAWLAANMPLLKEETNFQLMLEDEMGTRARELQRVLFDGGFAGLYFPKEYGGHGLPAEYQVAFNQESASYEMPVLLNVPTFAILAATLLDFGTEAQKKAHIPKILSGEEMWVQFLSEPSGGSDLAGLVTRATPDGDVFILNGSKIWSSGAFRSDYALCLARTDWHVPKHRGLTCFIVKIHQPGIEVQQIKMVNGVNEFCQEFFDDVAIPAADVLGEVNDGWTVATRLLYHEREAVAGGSPFASGVSGMHSDHASGRDELVELARATGRASDPSVRQLVAESRANDLVGSHLIRRVAKGMATGVFTAPAGSLPRLYAATNSERHQDIALAIAGPGAAVWEEGSPVGRKGVQFLMRQGGSLGGGSNEMQRNIISERLLAMPREYAADKDRPFDEVRHNASPFRPR